MAVVSLAFLALALGAMVWPPCRLPAGSVSAIDVGQGQSIVVRGSDGQVIMVDGGGSHDGRFDVGENVVAPCLLALGITRLEAVALSHGHPDHARGLAYVLENFPVGELWLAPGGGAYQDELRAVARARGVPVRELDEGIGRFEFRGIGLRVLHPPAGFKTDNENNRSLVIRLQDEQLSLLLTGDIERDVETRLVRRYGPRGEVASGALGSRVMIVPHHGSKTSSTREFILAVGAGTALVSAAGEDESGLPARSVLERYRALGVEVAATSEEGMVMAWDHPVRVGRVKP